MTKKPSLTPKQKAVLEAVKQGMQLTKTFEDGETVYGIEGVGNINRRTISTLLNRGILRERSDAMFGVGQTLEVA